MNKTHPAQCVRCHAPLSADRSICACGADLRTSCERCGAARRPGEHACGSCGLQRATPGEERKYVTVLFADIEESTALIAGADPEDAADRIQPAVQAMCEAVRRFQGTVNRVAGDGIMALFGAPVAFEDHAVRACDAALAIVQDVPRQTPEGLRVRVGLHSGEVLVRGIRNDFATDYDAIGETPHVAHRLESLATPNSVRLSAQTLRLAEGFMEARPLGVATLRGLASPVSVFELIGRIANQSRWGVRSLRGLTRFAGRDAEMRQLLDQLQAASSGGLRSVEIHGEAGVGKSRLTHELSAAAREQRWQVMTGAAEDGDWLSPWGALGRCLRQWLDIGEGESQAEVRGRLTRLCGLDGSPQLAPHLPGLLSLLDLPVDDERWSRLDPPERAERMRGALIGLVDAWTSSGPHVVVLEDVQWADRDTLAALDALIAQRAGSAAPQSGHGLLLVVTRRVEAGVPWTPAGAASLDLRPLTGSAGGRILDSLLGGGKSVEALKARLRERAGGNPLFLEESVRALLDAGTLQGCIGQLALEGPLGDVEIPASIQAAISARVDRLPHPLKARLQAAAVIGRPFSLQLLAALEGPPEPARDLQELEQLGFVVLRQATSGNRYGFRHGLIQEVVAAALPRKARRELNAQIVKAIERLYPDRLAEYAEELSERAFAAGLWDVAARYCLQSCNAAIERSASREALAIFERAFERFAGMPQDDTSKRVAIDLRLAVASALQALGAHRRQLETVLEAKRLVDSIGDERRSGLVCNHLSTALWLTGENKQALEVAQTGVAIARRLQNRALYIGARFAEGMAQNARGDYLRSLEVHRETLENYRGAAENRKLGWAGYPSVFLRTVLADCCLALGRLEDAARYVEEGSALAERFAHPYSQAMIRSEAGPLLVLQDRIEDAIELLTDTLAICIEHEIVTLRPLIAARLASAYLHLGAGDAALEILTPSLAPEVEGYTGHYTWREVLAVAAQTHLLRGDLELARKVADEAEHVCRSKDALGQLVLALEAQVWIERAISGSARSPRLHEAIDLARKLGMRPVYARLLRLAEP